MKPTRFVPSPRTRGRLFLALVAVIALPAARCNTQKPRPTTGVDDLTLVGDDRTGLPVAFAERELLNKIAQFRARVGLTTDQDPQVQGVAEEHAAFVASTGQLTPILNGQDFTTRLRALGLMPGPLGDAGSYVLGGYSSADAVMEALSLYPTILTSERLRIGISLTGRGAGNYWVVLFF